MPEEDYFDEAKAQFRITGPAVSEDSIDAAFTGSFPGKDDLVQFYLRHNGGCRSERGCLTYCGNPAHRIARDNLEKLRIEGFFAILPDPDVKAMRYRSMFRYHRSTLRTFAEVPEMKAFLESHRPIAMDHAGNDCWIDLQSGCVKYVLWDSWKQGPVVIAPSFREFVVKYWNHTTADPDIPSP